MPEAVSKSRAHGAVRRNILKIRYYLTFEERFFPWWGLRQARTEPKVVMMTADIIDWIGKTPSGRPCARYRRCI
jgi:hypothetical protein